MLLPIVFTRFTVLRILLIAAAEKTYCTAIEG